MRRRSDIIWSIVIVLIVAVAVWVVTNPALPIRLGLDLQGGLQVLLEADVPEDVEVTAEAMDTARQIIDRRVNIGQTVVASLNAPSPVSYTHLTLPTSDLV